jgi:uncharacterized OB-fold protein
MSTLRPYPVDGIELFQDRWTAPFWSAAAEHRFVVPYCTACGTYRFPPTPRCSACRSADVEWTHVTGLGTVYTFTVIRGGVPTPLRDHLPYAVVAVTLDDAPVRVVANYTGESADELRIGLPVEVCWAEGAGVTVPRFRRRSPA